MKLSVKNPANVVSSAWCKKVSELSFLLVINTTERHVFPEYTEHDSYSGTYAFAFGDSFEDEVILEPENDEEINILKRHRFERHCKDQLEYLFLADEVVDE
jgi:hypothetical protein